jgi:DNA-directed RNA polymerase specialized sigma24 family protein
LWQELAAGKHRGPKPFRIIVAGVVKFACKGWEGTTLGRDVPLEEWTQANDARGESGVEDDVLTRIDIEAFVASLPTGDGEIARLRFIDLLEIDQIAEQTGRKRNAVDQAVFRVRREWKKWLET